jgi:hypothetical protein
MTRHVLSAALLAALAIFPSRALAQDPDTPAAGTMAYGPFRITPSLVLRDMGIDNNVFNDSVDPKSDFTFTLTPRADVVFRMQRLRIAFGTAADYVYFHNYASERGTNTTSSVRGDVNLGRIHPYISAAGVDTRQRLNPEVDERARHHDVTYAAGVTMDVASRTHVRFNASRTTFAFDPGEAFRGVELRESFDGQRRTLDGGLSLDLTPITRFDVLVARERQTFVLSPDRDSETWRAGGGFTFSTDGVLRGSALLGYRNFHTISPAVPEFSGFVAAATVGATLYGRHDLLAVVNRDVQYSYDQSADFYIGTTTGLTWTMLLKGPFDVRATATRALMDYRTLAGSADPDRMITYGGGIGYRFTGRARLGVNTDWSRRTSDLSAERTYRNHRIFAGLTWGTTL